MFLLAAPYSYIAAQESNSDKKALREQRREERRQKREERKQDRQREEVPEELAPAMQNEPKNVNSENRTITQPTQQEQTRQKAPIKEETPAHKTPAPINSSQSIKKAIEQPLPNTATESKRESQSSSKDGNSALGGLIFLALLVIWILSLIFTRKCHHCKKYRAMIPVGETYLGRAKTVREKDSRGQMAYVYYNRVQVTRQCKYCGYRDHVVKIVRGDQA